MNELTTKVEQWGADKGILDNGTLISQLSKLYEEVDEVRTGIINFDREEIKDGIGDCVVVLILMARLADMSIEECLQHAYDIISKRTGRMVDGTFVKDQS